MFTQPFIRAQIKVNIKAPRHWPLCGEFTGDRWIPRTNGQLRGKCFHLMTSSCLDKHLPQVFHLPHLCSQLCPSCTPFIPNVFNDMFDSRCIFFLIVSCFGIGLYWTTSWPMESTIFGHNFPIAWWRHDMETFPVTVDIGGFPIQRASNATRWCFLWY